MCEVSKQIDDWISDLTDERLIWWATESASDLKEVAELAPETEEHEEAFAGALMFAKEMGRRGLKIPSNAAISGEKGNNENT